VELFLNLAWLAISLAVFSYFGRRRASAQDRVAVTLALVCVVCLLFPVISMTDDLNSSPALPEVTKLKRLLLTGHVVIGLFAQVLLVVMPQQNWTRLTLQEAQSSIQHELFSFNLNRRPPPTSIQA